MTEYKNVMFYVLECFMFTEMIMVSLPLHRCGHGHVDERVVHHSDHRRRGQTDDLLEAPELRDCL